MSFTDFFLKTIKGSGKIVFNLLTMGLTFATFYGVSIQTQNNWYGYLASGILFLIIFNIVSLKEAYNLITVPEGKIKVKSIKAEQHIDSYEILIRIERLNYMKEGLCLLLTEEDRTHLNLCVIEVLELRADEVICKILFYQPKIEIRVIEEYLTKTPTRRFYASPFWNARTIHEDLSWK